MARSDPQLNIRMPSELKERLEVAAKQSGRSVTQELIHRLEQSFTQTHSAFVSASDALPADRIALALAQQKQEMKALQLQNRASALESRLSSLEAMEQSMKSELTLLEMSGYNEEGKAALRDGLRDLHRRMSDTAKELQIAAEAFNNMVTDPREQGPRMVLVGHLGRGPRGALPDHIRRDFEKPMSQKSATPGIPGVNSPKRGLGSPATKVPNKPKDKPVVRKKKVFAKSDDESNET